LEGWFLSFECSRCGDCCTHLGLVHAIKEDFGNYRFLVNNQYTGEKTMVTVDPDKILIFHDRSTLLVHPDACPFFRVDATDAKCYCTIHQTRPEICRDFGCWRMLILDSAGKRVGRIMNLRHLASTDEALTRLFLEKVSSLAGCDNADWDARVIRVLIEAGYTVRT
jgi:uncharacterized protein